MPPYFRETLSMSDSLQRKARPPLIVKNRMWTELKINGYISSIKLRIEEATDSTN